MTFDKTDNLMEKRLLDIEDASAYLGIPVNTLRCWCSCRKIPYVKLGRMVRFDVTLLEEWFKENLIKPENFDNILEPGFSGKIDQNKRT